eukprot:CAMPEP_0175129660 /NCGR_PEP_ID=MMETSP0087-20121206/5592_1 /TAXON_ID=136419 /ORGANISM="Unknown Unknown, Strain D1" /LENGTH=746 /DNA_ID=CAMNT_0016411827 /DNA_START=47 /DNA_END=2284 /DNA_ORIENTATION=+
MPQKLKEARIVRKNQLLLVFPLSDCECQDEELMNHFCGDVVKVDACKPSSDIPSLEKKTIFLCGDISKAENIELVDADQVYVIRELSQHYHSHSPWPVVSSGRVPLDVHGVGVMYRRFFDPSLNFFQRIHTEHSFQALTESNKPGVAHRTGIYLTPVEKKGDALHFNLLRCSSNLSGPTGNFASGDRCIVTSLNKEASVIFQDHAPLNHVLAQTYYNTPASGTAKQTKAKIKAHADKTKDMPANAIMAFCSFYDKLDRLELTSAFDFCLNGKPLASGLTQLHFRLKRTVVNSTLPSQFSVKLYPNSVFFMPISTNRLYTHEIRPSALDPEFLPTRLGYVVRCSKTQAVHMGGCTYVKSHGKLLALKPPTSPDVAEVKRLYAEENLTDALIEYRHPITFSLNKGDYQAPLMAFAAGFRCISLDLEDSIFPSLATSVKWEDIGRGRQGAVLVQPNGRGTPVVRTTTKYGNPAQCFSPALEQLAQLIQQQAGLKHSFNNALVEKYTNSYTTMGFHSDQALDLEVISVPVCSCTFSLVFVCFFLSLLVSLSRFLLYRRCSSLKIQEGTSIAVFSCYRNPDTIKVPRKLVVQSKEQGNLYEIPMTHKSCIVFSLDTNSRHKHKIVLDSFKQQQENEWLGVTFRTSKTFISYRNGCAYFEDSTALKLCPEASKGAFYQHRGRENREIGFVYPPLSFTVSGSDLVPPAGTSLNMTDSLQEEKMDAALSDYELASRTHCSCCKRFLVWQRNSKW